MGVIWVRQSNEEKILDPCMEAHVKQDPPKLIDTSKVTPINFGPTFENAQAGFSFAQAA